MRDYAIAPTAQRLAEENNVDWRMLTGSGEGGSVVERDVLGYLARVMSGEEATNPTPEPLPEGLTAWPEEPERRRGIADRPVNRTPERPTNRAKLQNPITAQDTSNQDAVDQDVANQDTGPFTAPPPVTVTQPNLDAETHTPWTIDTAKAAPENPAKASRDDPNTSFGAVSESPVFGAPVAESSPEAAEVTAKTEGLFSQPELETDTPFAASSAEDAEALRAALAELETLKTRVAELEEERSRHANELHQLSRLQETVALQKNEGAKLGALQSEVRDLKAQLGAAQRAGERVEALAAHNRDLEARLVRARTFKSKAKAEFERIMEDNVMLEHELADFKKSRRGLFRRGRQKR